MCFWFCQGISFEFDLLVSYVGFISETNSSDLANSPQKKVLSQKKVSYQKIGFVSENRFSSEILFSLRKLVIGIVSPSQLGFLDLC